MENIGRAKSLNPRCIAIEQAAYDRYINENKPKYETISNGEKIHKPNVDNQGLYACHDYACPVNWKGNYPFPAVFDCHTEVFHPSHAAQNNGWRLVKANWFQKMCLWILFKSCR